MAHGFRHTASHLVQTDIPFSFVACLYLLMSASNSLVRRTAEHSQHEAQTINIAVVVTAAVFVILRLVARKTRGMGLLWDDWLEVVAMVLTLCVLVTALLLTHYGNGVHITYLSNEDIANFCKVMMAFECTYVTTIFAIKSSLLLMYNRMFPVRSIRIASIVLWTCTAILTIVVVFFVIFQCTPVAKTWSQLMPGQCVNRRALIIYSALLNIITDFAILGLPVGSVWNLEIRRNHKYILTCVFLSGCLFIVGGVYRFTVLFQYDAKDFTYTTLNIVIWTIIECSSGIITACIPTIVPLIQPITAFIFNYRNHKTVTENIRHNQSSSQERAISRSGTFAISSPQQQDFLPPSSSSNKKKPPRRGGMKFQRLGSAYDTPGNTDAWPMEVKVTTTIEIITSILENDGQSVVGSKPRVFEGGSIEMTQGRDHSAMIVARRI